MCTLCRTSIFEPWYVDSKIVRYTRCIECMGVITTHDEQCDYCQFDFSEDYWEEFEERFGIGRDLMHAPWARMVCCNSPWMTCVCDVPLHPAIFPILRSYEEAPTVYTEHADCHLCVHQFTAQCTPLVNMLERAITSMEPNGPHFYESQITSCGKFEEKIG